MKKRERCAKEVEVRTSLGILDPSDKGKVLARNLSPGGGPVKLKLFSEQEVAEVIQRHENYVTYTIKTISQPKKNRTLLRNIYLFLHVLFIYY